VTLDLLVVLDNVEIDATREIAYGSASTVKCAVGGSLTSVARTERTREEARQLDEELISTDLGRRHSRRSGLGE
jgi:hypothetical protein